MNTLRLLAGAAAFLIVGGCTNATGPDKIAFTDSVLQPQPDRAAASANAASRVAATGHYDAIVDFSTLTLTPRGRNCVLEVAGQLVFSGTIVGTATGRTTALVFATCDAVASSPPGTFADRFSARTRFTGTVNGAPVTANLSYVGRVQPGGAITARLVFSKGVSGTLEVENARVAVGGDYRGSVTVH